ncbi:hypothetical protein DFJ63DRAFT_314517 [Scheffersomyces coipomensis]|uniref:uncharacterized protein n=1 Tax=Scheffersomyces coipomensis TaxID=1788519 RepID=UPI00315C61AC
MTTSASTPTLSDSIHLKQPDSVLSPPPQKSPNHLSLRFISLISRNDKPLYIQSFNHDDTSSDNFLKYNFLSHMALDIFASPSSLNLREQQYLHYINHHPHQPPPPSSPQGQTVSPANGGIILLFIQDSIQVYGYETNNGLKIIIGISNTSTTHSKINFQDINILFKNVYKCYLRLICNPFNNSLVNNLNGGTSHNDDNSTGDQIIENVTFDNNIKKIVSNWV